MDHFVYNVQHMELLHGHVWRIFLVPPQKKYLQYKAGQYLEIFNSDHDPRPFSIANAPQHDHVIELHIRCVPDSPYAFSLIEHIKKTRELQIRGPFGQCTYKKIPNYPSILIAHGTGFAPIKAIIEQAISEGLEKPMYLYWSARTQADLYLNELPTQWKKEVLNFYYTPVLTGTLHDAVLSDFPNLAEHHVYASGPQDMVYTAWDHFQIQGLERDCMYSDAFDFPRL